MYDADFRIIKHFKQNEITDTGATIEDVNFRLIVAYDHLRSMINRPVKFVKNGFTTGNHHSKQHSAGLAGDCIINDKNTDTLQIAQIVECALESGFRGIGIYWNGSMYSYHLDLRDKYSFWTGIKNNPGDEWKYDTLFVDPAKL
jgi:hypothetical protein